MCLDKAVLAQGGGGGMPQLVPVVQYTPSPCKILLLPEPCNLFFALSFPIQFTCNEPTAEIGVRQYSIMQERLNQI